MAGLSRSQHLSLPFKDIELATKNFEMCIGRGGYGRVYKGELYIAGKLTTVAIKRLDVQFGQGLKEFLTEIELLTGLQHPNLISLLGYCDEGNEKIIIYEYAERGSLEKYISHSNTSYVTLTWLERLKICIDAARGLDHLHSHVGKHQTIIHRDIKSANILIDENWVAKISDFGLSKLSLAGLDRSAVISHACGTLGYCDPEYVSSGFVTKKSDVYSFGMVLFEVLCGKLCTVRDKDGPLLSARVAKDCYKNKKLDEIIDPSLRELMSSYSMSKFSEIAYGCLDEDRERRPPMDVVKKELEEILEIQENLEILSRCIRERFGFKDGNPVAASVIYKCLLHWDAFESERTEFFNFIIENINNVLQKGDEDVTLPYWLSNASALLCLLQRNFRSNGFLTRIYQCSGVSALTNGRVTQGLTPHKHIGFYDGMSLMEARSPAILFKQQLTLCVEKIFGLIRDNLKKEISPLLFSCIQVPKNQRVHGSKPSRSREGIPQQAAGSQWEKIIEFLDSLMDRLRANHVPSFFIRKLTTQVFSFINVSLFNSFLLRQECCSFSNGEYVNSGLAELEKWIVNAKEEFAGTSWHELNYIRQAAGFLVIHQKRKKSLEEIRQDLCPALTIRQIYRISTRYWDDKYGTKGVSNEVVAEMREILNKDSQNLKSNSFLLDDDLSIPFSAEDIYMAIPVFDPTDIEAPTLLFDYPSAQFLQNPK